MLAAAWVAGVLVEKRYKDPYHEQRRRVGDGGCEAREEVCSNSPDSDREAHEDKHLRVPQQRCFPFVMVEQQPRKGGWALSWAYGWVLLGGLNTPRVGLGRAGGASEEGMGVRCRVRASGWRTTSPPS